MRNFPDESSQEKQRVAGTLLSKLGRRGVFATVLMCILAASVIYTQMYMRAPLVEKRNIVAIIRVEGYIETPSTVIRCADIINQAILNESVKAVVLLVDSGGGYGEYVEHIYLDLLELKARNKTLIASIATALSGGYYITAAADYIYALPTSFVGNIGAIGRGPPILIPSENTLETGAYKATGFSMLLFPHNLSRALDNFVSAVNKSRAKSLKLSLTQLKRGMIYLGSEAVDIGLADDTGSLQKAIQKAAKTAGLEVYEVVELTPRGAGLNVSWQGSSSPSSTVSESLALELLDELHPPPAIHYIYFPPQVIMESSSSPKSSPTPATGKADVLVDISHGNQISWLDLDILLAELAKRNVTASFVPQWYELKSKLKDASCLIVAASTGVYTDEELGTIEAFVEEGGFLVMFFDPAWEHIGAQGLLGGIIAPANSLASRFGLSFARGYLYNEGEYFGFYRNIYVRNFTANLLTRDLRSLVFFTATHIHSMGNGVAWTSSNTYSSVAEKPDYYATVALTKRGKGNVAAFGDITFLSEPFCHVEDNYELILNLASLVAEAKADLERSEEG